ncbi:hypothetical protein OQA88_7048 [Cercophora sp. LCS_1]
MSTSATTSDSHSASAEASTAASAAVFELAAGLNFVFDELESDVHLGDQIQYHLEQLCDEAEKYPGSMLHDGVGEEWPCSPGMSELLRATCRCASMVYEQTQDLGAKGFEIEPLLHRPPSSMGTVKASSMWKIPFIPMPEWAGKTLVVSIRGTASVADHMVNMNDRSKGTGALFRNVEAHAGFLGCAEAMLATISQDIQQQFDADDKIYNVVFTGHSAGGAVASLVFLRFLFQQTQNPWVLKNRLSLVTFGSPPVVNSSITSLCKEQPNAGLVLSLVNEYDMVSRADRPYLRSIVDLYRSRRGLPLKYPQMGETAPDPDIWPLPPPTLRVVGDIIILQRPRLVGMPSASDGDSFSQASTLVAPTYPAVKLTEEEFSKLLFCDTSVHRRRAYLDRVETLAAQSCEDCISKETGPEAWKLGNALIFSS